MKVKNLIEELERLPKNYNVDICVSIYNCSSGYDTDYSADIKKVIVDNEDMSVTIYGVE